MALIDVRVGDLTTAQADVIVTSANKELTVGGGVNGALHAAAGPRLAEACAALGGCPVGEVRVTPAFDLQARHVIHAVAPRWTGGEHGEPVLLRAVYRAIIEQAVAHECHTVALPSIATGAFGAAARARRADRRRRAGRGARPAGVGDQLNPPGAVLDVRRGRSLRLPAAGRPSELHPAAHAA